MKKKNMTLRDLEKARAKKVLLQLLNKQKKNVYNS